MACRRSPTPPRSSTIRSARCRWDQMPNTAVTYFDPNRRTGYSQQFNLGMQHELPADDGGSRRSLGNLSRKLPSANLTLNQIPPHSGPGSTVAEDRPFPQFSDVTMLAAAARRFQLLRRHGPLRKALFARAESGRQLHLFQVPGQHQRSGHHLGRRRRAVFEFLQSPRATTVPRATTSATASRSTAVYELAVRPRAAGCLSSRMRSVDRRRLVALQRHARSKRGRRSPSSRRPTPPTLSRPARCGPMCCAIRICPSDQRTVAQWFDTAAFAQPAPYPVRQRRRGHCARRRPGESRFLAACAISNFTERVRMQFRGEFFNAINHTNFGLPGQRLSGAGFGVISGVTVASGPTTVQVGARIAF